MTYYGSASHASADLKRTAHAVRQAIDAKPKIVGPDGRVINPRKLREIERVSEWDRQKPIAREQPYLSPRARHAYAWGKK